MRRLVPLVPFVLGVLLLAGCGGYADTVVPEPEASSAGPAAPVTTEPCEDDGSQRRSYDPADGTIDGPAVQRIRARGKLVAGVAADTYLLGARNARTGVIEGFDIDMVNAIAAKIFGSAKGHVELKVITASNRIPFLQDGTIDIVSRNMTVNCTRWQQIAFSEIYYDAGQKVLVGADSDATSIDALSGKKVCAPASTTTLTRLQDEFPNVEAVSAATHTECLVLFQQGKVDAITGDDTILAGFAAQDPYAKVVGEPISAEPYGLGMPADKVELVQFVNGVLDRMRSDGTWTSLYTKWLSVLGPAPAPPVPVYGR